MFTGIVEAVGQVSSTKDGDEVRYLRIEGPEGYLADVAPGASIAVDGACLTATSVDDRTFSIDVVGTTLRRTIAGGYEEGSRVNLERALVLGGRLDGHLVQGHVDGLGTVTAIRESGGFRFVSVEIPGSIHAQTIAHGSITLNGVSLTVNRLFEPANVEVAIIPHTWDHTNFRYLEVGDHVNVEGDMIAKYVFRSIESVDHSAEGSEDGV